MFMKVGSKRALAALVAAGAVTAVSMASVADAAAASCVYDAGAQSMTVGMDPAGVTTLSVSAGSLLVDGSPCLGATTTNTDSIAINGNVGSSERLILDQRGGVFGPGVSPESNVPEIEMTANLGDASDTVVVYGTEGADRMAAGENGFAFFGDGDVDVVITPHALNLEVHLLGGDDYFNGRGTFGAGLAFKGPITATGGDGNDFVRGSVAADTIDGGAGDDELEGNFGDDEIDAGPGDDSVNGGSENDVIQLGTGADSVIAGAGSDVVYADDGEADVSLVGGAHADTIVYDCGLDPAPSQFETATCGGTPPPPPSGPCIYDPATKKVTATIAPADEGSVLAVGSAGEIMFRGLACPGATTANTESITVIGTVGDVDTLLIDRSEQVFIGGTPEADSTSEIEITLSLGDTTDAVAVTGAPGPDVISVGLKGISLGTDADLDVAISPLPERIAISGGGGVNTLTGRGGYGTGGVYTGILEALAGPLGDTIIGGDGADVLVGGAGNDVIEGRDGDDSLEGHGGDDTLNGQGGNDTITGHAGADSMSGSAGDDLFRADDAEADTSINGGPGVDTAYYDGALDPNPLATETKIAV